MKYLFWRQQNIVERIKTQDQDGLFISLENSFNLCDTWFLCVFFFKYTTEMIMPILQGCCEVKIML